MTSTNQQLNPIRKGQTHLIRWTLTDIDGAAYSSFTGITFEFEMADDENATPVISVNDANFTKDAANSRVSIELTSTETATLDVGLNRYRYELHMFTDSGVKKYVAAAGGVSVVDSLLD